MNYMAYIVTAASIVGTVANSFQKKWCFWVWICTNVFWCVYNAANKQYAQALLYAFNFAMCIIGLCKWKKQTIAVDTSSDDTSVIYDEPEAERQKETEVSSIAPEGPSEETQDHFTRMSNAVTEFMSALIDAVQPTIKAFTDAINNFAKYYCNGDYGFLIWQQKNADPRIIHRAYNAKRYRTRKKNLSRLKREYKKYIKKGGGSV